jgi:hypothetical protein
MALIIAAAATLSLIAGGKAAYGPGIAQLFPSFGAYVWSSCLLIAAIAAIVGVTRRQYDIASAATLALALLLSVNGAVTISANGDGAVWAAAAYAGFAVAFLDRSKKLRAPIPLPPLRSGRQR